MIVHAVALSVIVVCVALVLCLRWDDWKNNRRAK